MNNKRGKGTKGTWATHSQKAGKLKIYSQCNPTLLKTLSIVVQLVKLALLGGGGEKKVKFISTKRHIYMSFYQVKSIKNGCRCMNISNDEDK